MSIAAILDCIAIIIENSALIGNPWGLLGMMSPSQMSPISLANYVLDGASLVLFFVGHIIIMLCTVALQDHYFKQCCKDQDNLLGAQFY